MYAGKNGGKSPKWLAWLTGKVFVGMWRFYDGGFSDLFGDGERTVGREGNTGDGRKRGAWSKKADLIGKGDLVLA